MKENNSAITDFETLSYSKASSFENCERKFSFSYVEKIRTESGIHAAVGTFVHEIIEEFYNQNNFFDYIRLIKYYDQNIFKQLQKVVPARAKSNMGTLIEGNIFERPKSPVQRNNPVKTEPFYEKTIKLILNMYLKCCFL